MSRAGYALLAVLWMCTGVSALALAVCEAARHAMASSRNRIGLTEAAWNAHACLVYARAAIAEAMAGESRALGNPRSDAWNRVENVLRTVRLPPELSCDVSTRAVGAGIDVNSADEGTLRAAFREVGLTGASADSTLAVLITWRKAHGPFSQREQLRAALGPGLPAPLDTILDVEAGPPALNQAASVVLRLLPGFTPEAVEQLLAARRRGVTLQSFQEISATLSGEARETFDRGSAALAGVATLDPTAWILTARSAVGRPPVRAVVELRVTRAGESSAITRRRTWIE